MIEPDTRVRAGPVADRVGTAGQWTRATTTLLAVITSILAVQFFRDTYPVTMPLAAAVFLAMLVYPLQSWLVRRLPRRIRWMGTVVALLVILAALAAFAGAFALAATLVAERVPQYADRLQTLWGRVSSWATSHGIPFGSPGPPGVGGPVADRVVDWLTRGVRSLWAGTALLVLVLFFVLLMLLEVPRWTQKVRAGFGGGRAATVVDTVTVTARQVRRYLLLCTVLGLITAALEGLWLWAAGVDLPFVWALLFFVLNYIPTLGSVMAAVPPALVALATLGIGRAVLAAAGMFVIEQVMGNFVDPRWVGRRLSISPLVVLAAVVFWGWVWGVPGALLAVPMTATLVVAFAHAAPLHPVALLLSRSTDGQDLHDQTHSGAEG